MLVKVYSIIVTYNPDIVDLEEALDSHLKTSVNGIVMVDNYSSNVLEIESLVNKLRPLIPVQLKKLDKNRGVGYAQNEGIKFAIESNYSHIILFDQDSVVPPDLLTKLLLEENELLSKGYKVGAIGPIYSDSRTGNFYPQIKVNSVFVKKIWPELETETNLESSFIIASGSLIKLDTLKVVGLMNEALFIDCVDIEWCFRAASKGFVFFSTKAVVISHKIGDVRVKSLGREISIHSALRRYYMVRNNLLLSRMAWVPIGYRIRLVFGTIFKTPVHLLDVGFSMQHVKFSLKGILDGLLNRGGAYIK
ncbi:MAG: rhamnosyltransferase [Daejeonella sp.]|nr:rhamnosyltransferase [Daejeonella sp.]